MKMGKQVLQIIIAVAFIALLIMPLIMMKQLSEQEINQYTQNNEYEYREAAYGTPRMIERKDVKQYFCFDGMVTSDTYEFIEFKTYEGAEIKSMVSVGDEVKAGDIVAYMAGKEMRAEHNGIVEEVLTYVNGYIKLRSLNELKLTCMAERKLIDKVRNCKTLKLGNGKKVKIDSISNVATDNKVKIVFTIEKNDYMYGQELKNLKIYTGKVYHNVLVVDKNCVYQKRKNGPYYIRVLDEQLFFVNELEVKIGFQMGNLICLTDAEEGTICDSGYKELIESKQE